MKKTFLSLLLLQISFFLSAQWVTVTSPFSGSLYCMETIDQNTAFIGGAYKLLKSTDGGNTWTIDLDLTTAGLNASLVNDIHFTNSNIGFIVSNAGKMLRTTDQGATWNSVLSNTANGFAIHSIYFTSPSYGFLVGVYGDASKTSDAGITWTQTTLNTTNDLNDIRFYGNYPLIGLAVGEAGTIKKTTNAGLNWTTVLSGTTSELRNIFILNDNTAFVVGANGKILKSTDLGVTWNSINSGVTTELRAICFKDNLQGCIVGGSGTILITVDGGTTWQAETSGTSNTLYDVSYFNNQFFAVGLGGTILKRSGLLEIEIKETEKTLNLYPNPSNGNFTLSWNGVENISKIELCDLTGKLITQFNTSSSCIDNSNCTLFINLYYEDLSPGTYLINLKSEDAILTRRIIIH